MIHMNLTSLKIMTATTNVSIVPSEGRHTKTEIKLKMLW